jgi:hypothetical protein
LAAAIAGEAQGAGLRSRAWGERAAAMGALACLVPLYLADAPANAPANGPANIPGGAIGATAVLSVAAAAALTAVVLFARTWLAGVPRWAPDVAAGIGVAAALVIA